MLMPCFILFDKELHPCLLDWTDENANADDFLLFQRGSETMQNFHCQ